MFVVGNVEVGKRQLGKKGSDVAELQAFLGISPTDGIFGPMTETAVIEFQTKAQIEADGIVGPQTYAAIDESKVSQEDIIQKTIQTVKKVARNTTEKVKELPVQTKTVAAGLIIGIALIFFGNKK